LRPYSLSPDLRFSAKLLLLSKTFRACLQDQYPFVYYAGTFVYTHLVCKKLQGVHQDFVWTWVSPKVLRWALAPLVGARLSSQKNEGHPMGLIDLTYVPYTHYSMEATIETDHKKNDKLCQIKPPLHRWLRILSEHVKSCSTNNAQTTRTRPSSRVAWNSLQCAGQTMPARSVKRPGWTSNPSIASQNTLKGTVNRTHSSVQLAYEQLLPYSTNCRTTGTRRSPGDRQEAQHPMGRPELLIVPQMRRFILPRRRGLQGLLLPNPRTSLHLLRFRQRKLMGKLHRAHLAGRPQRPHPTGKSGPFIIPQMRGPQGSPLPRPFRQNKIPFAWKLACPRDILPLHY